MSPRKLSFRLALALTGGAVLGGCSTSQPALTIIDFQPIPLEVAAPQLAAAIRDSGAPRFASLGAGDALGRAVYVNNIILAARQQAQQAPSSLADVPTDDAQMP